MANLSTEYGPIEAATRLDLNGADSALAETAYALARTLDDGAGANTAAVARELRLTLAELATDGPADEKDDVVDQLRARRERAAG
jgi:hypothetical protein